MKRTAKHPEDMTAEELAEATREFDRPFAFEKARPMTPRERREEHKLRRGRPKIGMGSQKISISLERTLVEETDLVARKRGVKRSELIASFVVAGLRKAG